MADGHDSAATHDPPPMEAMAERLRTLERQLAALQDPARLEAQIAERVLARVQSQAAAPDGYASSRWTAPSTGVLGTAAGLLPLVVAPGGFWSRFGGLREARLVLGMYVDSRYRVSRLTQLAVPGILALMVANYFLFNWLVGVVLISPLFERLLLILLAVALYKVLSREAGRYGEVLAYLTRYAR